MEELGQQFNITDALVKNGIDDIDTLLALLPSDASRLLRITPAIVQQLYQAASVTRYPIKDRQSSIGSLKDRYLTSHDAHIDSILGKGIPLGSITEVVGESSSGKTQLCLQLCFTVQKPESLGGLGGARWFGEQYNMAPTQLSQAIHTSYVPTTEDFYRSIAYQLPVLLKRKTKIRLVVIDSIGSAYRGTSSDLSRQAQFDSLKEINELGGRLKKLAHQHQIAIVVVNQVSDTIVNEHQLGYLPTSMDDWLDITLEGDDMTRLGMFIQSLAKKPILGTTWSASVTTRIRMARSLLLEGQSTKRALLLEFSPWLPRRGCEIVLDEHGIKSKMMG
ncbi:P-loop containing nucleoside triphosphate hydrolase protein [Chlamydoabsidia padenii]|nr:P-loop containing nucleoside triphosphate hydrolase protein [Chlamydoabsidia padenii]